MIRSSNQINMMIIFLLYLASTTARAEGDFVIPSEDKIRSTTGHQQVHSIINTPGDTALGDVIFELDVSTPTNDNQLLGVEFDGTYFYVTGGAGGFDPNKVYVIDTLGNVVLVLDQPDIPDYWGWRDLTWDGVYTGVDRIDTLYGSCGQMVHKFGISFADSTLDHYGSFSGPCYPLNRALAYMEDSAWFFTSTGQASTAYDSCYNYKFSKADTYIDSVLNYYHMYGAAYDSDILEGGYVWWHSQDYLGSPFYCLIEQMDAISMNFTGLIFDIVPTTINSGIAGGLCFYEGFRDMDVLFALVQGNPVDIIVGIFVRYHVPGIAEEPGVQKLRTSGITSCAPNPTRRCAVISYATTTPGKVSLNLYDKTGQLVKTLVNESEPAGTKHICWDGVDNRKTAVPSGVYFLRFETKECKETEKIILSR